MSQDPTASDLLGPAERELGARARDVAAGLEAPEPPAGDAEAEDYQARAALASLAESGLLRTVVPQASAGPTGGFSVRSVCVIREELAYGSGLADVMYVMQGLGSHAIALAAMDDLKARLLPRVASGEIIAAFALTEPEAGSDVGGIATRARLEGDHYVLNGTKTYISNAGLAGLYTVFARVGSSSSRLEGITAFAVEAPTPGLIVRHRISVSAPHPIGTIELAGCRVPAGNRLGAEGEGYSLAMRVLERFRPTVGAAANGFARRALDESVARCRHRRQFGRPIGELQALRFMLADMAVRLESARLLVLRAATLLDSGATATGEVRRASAMAKLFATEAAQRTVDEAVQIHGGLGVTRGHVVERLYREVRALRIYEGTSEIQRAIIARTLLKDAP